MTEPEYNRNLGIVRLLAIYAAVGVLLYLASPTPLGVTVGFLIAAIGEAIRFWAAGHLLKTAELVTSGPYRYTRNPLYLGRLLILTGICVMAKLPFGLNWLALVLGYAGFFFYYLPRKERVEPDRLERTHGEPYARYRKAVPALFPTFRPYRHASTQDWSSDRMLRNREHWMVIGIVAVSAFLLWRSYTP